MLHPAAPGDREGDHRHALAHDHAHNHAHDHAAPGAAAGVPVGAPSARRFRPLASAAGARLSRVAVAIALLWAAAAWALLS